MDEKQERNGGKEEKNMWNEKGENRDEDKEKEGKERKH